MEKTEQAKVFGAAGDCVSLGEVAELIASNRSKPTIRKLAAAYGMFLQASQSVRMTSRFEDSRYVVDQLARAKAEIDIAAWHAPDATEATALVLAGTQAFFEQETIGSTEWPTPNELSAVATKIASGYAARVKDKATHPSENSDAAESTSPID